MVGDGHLAEPRLRRAAADLGQPLMDVAHLGVPRPRPLRVGRVVGEELRVAAEVVPAAAGVADDGVERLRREEVDHPPREQLRGLRLAVVGVQRPAAGLHGRGHHLAAIGEEHVGRVAVDLREDEVLHAAREQGDAVTDDGRPLHGTDERRREPRGDDRALGLEAPEIPGQQADEPEAAGGRLDAEPLDPAERAAGEAQQARAQEEAAEGDRAPEAGRQGPGRSGRLDLGARRLDEAGVVDAGGACRLAGEAAQAIAHLVGEALGRREVAVGHRAHEGDAAARAVALALGRVVGRARRQAHPAVHALLEDRVVEKLERGAHRLSRRSCPD